MGRKNKEMWNSLDMNQHTYADYYTRLKGYAISMFEWINLPPSVDERFLELTLYEKGYALFFINEQNGAPMALTSTIGGQLNVYRVPIWRRAYATNGFQQSCYIDDSVIIFNNYNRTPTFLTVELYARRLFDIQRTIDVNINAQKTPMWIQCSENQALTMKNIWMKYDGNEPLIITDKDVEVNPINVIKTDAPFLSDKLMLVKHMIWNEAMTFLGIDNANTDKKERLVSSEVDSNIGQIEASRYYMLNARKEACKKINDMFGYDIDVRFRRTNFTEQGQIEKENESTEETEVDGNE